MIELAPNFKTSLVLAHPLIVAAGGYADFLDAPNVGAVVTLPTTLHARANAPQPRVIEMPGGALVNTRAANPGLTKAIREHERAWARSRVPIIFAFAAQAAHEWSEMALRLASVSGIGGIELHINPTMDATSAIRAVRAASELPILVNLDLANARAIASECARAGANALVVGRAPRGMAMVNGRAWHGRLHAPTVKPLALNVLKEIRDLKVEIPLIGCGGIHSADDAREFLDAGAVAIQIDSAVWVNPHIVAELGDVLKC
jgi:dihydroorotate dehydrogenase (NAD+) catalytic subunit